MNGRERQPLPISIFICIKSFVYWYITRQRETEWWSIQSIVLDDLFLSKKQRRDNNVCPNVDQDALFDIIKRGAEHRRSLFGCIYVWVCHSLTDKEHNGRKLARWCYLKEVVAFCTISTSLFFLFFIEYIYSFVRSLLSCIFLSMTLIH